MLKEGLWACQKETVCVVWEGQFKGSTQDVKQEVGNSAALHETKLQKFNTNLLHKHFFIIS